MKTDRSAVILQLARELASESEDFFKVKGPGAGDKANHRFMAELRARAKRDLRTDYSEKKICGEIGSAVDFYVKEERTIVEIALGLSAPQSEFHKDLFKALLAKENGNDVTRLLFIAKPGAIKRHREPASVAIIQWLKKYYNISINIQELSPRKSIGRSE